MGLRGDTKLELALGSTKVDFLVDQTVSNPYMSEPAFVWNGSKLVIGEVSNVRLLGVEQIFEVVLDDNSTLQVSASSKFIMKSGDRKVAPELVPGDSLLPLYIEEDTYGYPTYRIPGRAAKHKIYRLMAEWKLGRPLGSGTVVEHIDGNRKNYHPDNLQISINKRSRKRTTKNKLVKPFKDAQKFLDECAAASPLMAKIVHKGRKTNHKVRRVTPGLMGEVYTASVRSGDSVSASGVFLELPA
jgi:hypothetical protein